MTKSQSDALVTFINFLNSGNRVPPFEFEIEEDVENYYKVTIRVTTTAYVNEANALAMAIDGCTYLSTRLKYDKTKGIIWEII